MSASWRDEPLGAKVPESTALLWTVGDAVVTRTSLALIAGPVAHVATSRSDVQAPTLRA